MFTIFHMNCHSGATPSEDENVGAEFRDQKLETRNKKLETCFLCKEKPDGAVRTGNSLILLQLLSVLCSGPGRFDET